MESVGLECQVLAHSGVNSYSLFHLPLVELMYYGMVYYGVVYMDGVVY